MARFHVRCKHCEKRRVLRELPESYEFQPKCNGCGMRSYRIDTWMQKRNTRAMACTCAGYHFWHRKGSFYCWYRPDGSDRFPGDVDFHDRWADAA